MSTEDFKRYFAECSAEYRRELPAKLAALEELWHRVTSAHAPSESMQQLQRDLHTLVGTAQTMGFPAVTAAARVAETYLISLSVDVATQDADARETFARLLDDLKHSAHAHA